MTTPSQPPDFSITNLPAMCGSQSPARSPGDCARGIALIIGLTIFSVLAFFALLCTTPCGRVPAKYLARYLHRIREHHRRRSNTVDTSGSESSTGTDSLDRNGSTTDVESGSLQTPPIAAHRDATDSMTGPGPYDANMNDQRVWSLASTLSLNTIPPSGSSTSSVKETRDASPWFNFSFPSMQSLTLMDPVANDEAGQWARRDSFELVPLGPVASSWRRDGDTVSLPDRVRMAGRRLYQL